MRGADTFVVGRRNCELERVVGEALRCIEVAALPGLVRAETREPRALGRLRREVLGGGEVELCATCVMTQQPGGSQLPVRNVQELIAWAKAHPGQVNFGSAGNASSQHLSGELFRLKTGAQMQHVPYKGSSPALTDLMGGQIQLMFDSMPSAMPFIASGRLRALAVTSASRSSSLPDVPTMEEAGMPGFRTSTWYGLWAPKNTPQDVVQKLWTESRRVLAEPQIAAQYRRLGAEPVGSTPAEFARYIQAEARKWEEIVKASGARAD